MNLASHDSMNIENEWTNDLHPIVILHLSNLYMAYAFYFLPLSSDALYRHYNDAFIDECNNVDRRTLIREKMLLNSSKCFYQKYARHYIQILSKLR